VFRATLRGMIASDRLPDYRLSENPAKSCMSARTLAPGRDPHTLEAEWKSWWHGTGRPWPRAPDRAFLGWIRTRGPAQQEQTEQGRGGGGLVSQG